MANGRSALSTSDSLGIGGKSPRCQNGPMWMTVLAIKTITAESRIGSHSAAMVIIGLPSLFISPRRSAQPEPCRFGRLYRESGSRLIRYDIAWAVACAEALPLVDPRLPGWGMPNCSARAQAIVGQGPLRHPGELRKSLAL